MKKMLGLAGILAVSVLALVGCDRKFQVPTASMEPTIPKGGYVKADMRAYQGKAPARFDVVVYAPPAGEESKYTGTVIGLPGETVQLDGSGVVKINGAPTAAPSGIPYRSYEKNIGGRALNQVTLKADEYFLLGDNTDNSFDCRFFGPVQKSEILGKVTVINGKSVP